MHVPWSAKIEHHVDELVQVKRNSSAYSMKLLFLALTYRYVDSTITASASLNLALNLKL